MNGCPAVDVPLVPPGTPSLSVIRVGRYVTIM